MKLTLTHDEIECLLQRVARFQCGVRVPLSGGFFRQAAGAHGLRGGQSVQGRVCRQLGEVALKTLDTYAPTYSVFARALGLPRADTLPTNPTELASLTRALEANPEQVRETKQAAWLAFTVYNRVVKKLQSEPIEDNRIDFEDGYGNRPDEEEDQHAAAAADEVAKGMSENLLSPFIGIRVKTFSDECKVALDSHPGHFPDPAGRKTGGKLPQTSSSPCPRSRRRRRCPPARKFSRISKPSWFCQGFAAHGNHDRNDAVDHQFTRAKTRCRCWWPLPVAAAVRRFSGLTITRLPATSRPRTRVTPIRPAILPAM
jgi:hypothetical protein